MEIPDLTDASKGELKELGAELASHHAMEKVAWAMGEDLGVEAARAVQEQVGDAVLRRIGIEPSPELSAAYAQFYAEAQRFANLSRRAAESQGYIEKQEADASFLNVSRTADRIAATMETVNVTDVLVTATQLMVEAEPYLDDAIAHPVDPEARVSERVGCKKEGRVCGVDSSASPCLSKTRDAARSPGASSSS